MTRLLGAIPDPPDARDFKAGAFVDRKRYDVGLSRAGFSRSRDWRAILAAIRSQDGNSCVGERIAGQIDAHARAAAVANPVHPSPKAIYSIARQRVHGPVGQLPDEGCIPREAMKGVRRWGVVPLDQWNPADVNERVTEDVLHDGAAFPVTSYHRIEETEDETIRQICAALDVGIFPSFVMPVDDAYMRLQGDALYDATTGPIKGAHDQMLAGYDLDGPYPFAWVRGSWGSGFALDGYARVSLRFIASAAVRDRWVVDVVPVLAADSVRNIAP